MRANVVDVDIPEEISQYAELKTLTEDVGRNARVISGVFCKAGEWRKTDQWSEGEVRSRGAQERSEITTITISNVCPMCQTHAVQAFRSGRCFMNPVRPSPQVGRHGRRQKHFTNVATQSVFFSLSTKWVCDDGT